jgi:hypothetical protein
VISPHERARVLDAEMRLQRAWLELSLREVAGTARNSSWPALKLGKMGLALLQHRSLWVAAMSLAVNMFRRRANKEKHS